MRSTSHGMVPPPFHSTPVTMQDGKQDQSWVSRLALPASVAVHLGVAALLILGLPQSLRQTPKEQAVDVDLVPPPKPPEKPKPKPSPPAQKPKPEMPKADKVEAKPPRDAAKTQTQPSLTPVFQFGEKDSGPRKSLDGNSAEDGSKSPPEQQEPSKQEPAKPLTATAPTEESLVSLPQATEVPKSRPTNAAKARKASKLKQARTLFSRSATGDSTATTAMAGLPRGVRGGTLCVTELREQLLNASPPYFPDLLPSYPLKDGTVIDVPKAAFRVNGRWQDLSYRCEVDADATKVVYFAFSVGDPIPPSEWERRGLPSR